ncbi:MAG: methylenetetrahydrofolate reductase C-terminal domain-containing protein, partial [Pseudomonadota bacterium]
MIKTRWKPLAEIEEGLASARRVAVFSCGFCANLCGTGGTAGQAAMEGLLRSWGREVTASACLNGCCLGQVMRQAVALYLDPVRDRTDALVLVSCAGGVKSAILANPGMPVVTALDSLGSEAMWDTDHPVATSLCVGCGQCVLTLTGGICPRTACPRGLPYGPCRDFPREGGPCANAPSRLCIWAQILENADPKHLE